MNRDASLSATAVAVRLATAEEVTRVEGDRALGLERTTEAIRELISDEWRNTIEIGRNLAEMVERRLWQASPELVAWAERSGRGRPVQGEALIARHLTARGLTFNRQRVAQLVDAARLAEVLARNSATVVAPSAETQIRPLVGLRGRLSTNHLAKLWNEAVEVAGGDIPTAAQVKAVVRRHHPPEPTTPRVQLLRKSLSRLTAEELDEVMKMARELRKAR